MIKYIKQQYPNLQVSVCVCVRERERYRERQRETETERRHKDCGFGDCCDITDDVIIILGINIVHVQFR